MDERDMFCATCATEMPFEAPPCGDGHDGDCPELLCRGCGAAVLVGPIVVRAWLRPAGRSVAPQPRRAAA
ncbi:MAG TPA: hypothetical protein VNV66_18590 [Pilimelia sp.]|nr:hypothetical protein [Pilimelia sp.]